VAIYAVWGLEEEWDAIMDYDCRLKNRIVR